MNDIVLLPIIEVTAAYAESAGSVGGSTHRRIVVMTGAPDRKYWRVYVTIRSLGGDHICQLANFFVASRVGSI
ncbi:hypothetical protein ELI_10890 [Erythrobacter litoralis HTCC2594]|uniref:Uncharacterized protein n=1 Tax=Erythrobacter litoralis (strain HTCC2594) TaxID=314225 RepID=Q2N7S1_ERYLH|nr:hypothetical protein ELI_10890 [Erythrobacter litoralis HTCC2594]